MKWKYYIVPAFSFIALFLYSLPWTSGATHTALGFYLIAFFWFMILGWIVLLVQTVFCIKLWIEKNSNWKHHLLASILIAVSYIGFLIGISNGYMVTV